MCRILDSQVSIVAIFLYWEFRYTGIGVPVVFVVGAFLLPDELLVHYFFELDHFEGCERLRLGCVWGEGSEVGSRGVRGRRAVALRVIAMMMNF